MKKRKKHLDEEQKSKGVPRMQLDGLVLHQAGTHALRWVLHEPRQAHP